MLCPCQTWLRARRQTGHSHHPLFRHGCIPFEHVVADARTMEERGVPCGWDEQNRRQQPAQRQHDPPVESGCHQRGIGVEEDGTSVPSGPRHQEGSGSDATRQRNGGVVGIPTRRAIGGTRHLPPQPPYARHCHGASQCHQRDADHALLPHQPEHPSGKQGGQPGRNHHAGTPCARRLLRAGKSARRHRLGELEGVLQTTDQQRQEERQPVAQSTNAMPPDCLRFADLLPMAQRDRHES